MTILPKLRPWSYVLMSYNYNTRPQGNSQLFGIGTYINIRAYVQPSPVQSSLVQCSLTLPNLVQSIVQSSQVQSSPVQSSPVQSSSPVQASPTQSCLIQSSLVQFSLVQSCTIMSCLIMSCHLILSRILHPEHLRLRNIATMICHKSVVPLSWRYYGIVVAFDIQLSVLHKD